MGMLQAIMLVFMGVTGMILQVVATPCHTGSFFEETRSPSTTMVSSENKSWVQRVRWMSLAIPLAHPNNSEKVYKSFAEGSSLTFKQIFSLLHAGSPYSLMTHLRKISSSLRCMNGLASKKVRVLWMNFTGYINWKPARGIRSFGIVVGPIISNTLLSNVLTFETQNTLLRIILLGPKHPVYQP